VLLSRETRGADLAAVEGDGGVSRVGEAMRQPR
jgi:hypothetical protein